MFPVSGSRVSRPSPPAFSGAFPARHGGRSGAKREGKRRKGRRPKAGTVFRAGEHPAASGNIRQYPAAFSSVSANAAGSSLPSEHTRAPQEKQAFLLSGGYAGSGSGHRAQGAGQREQASGLRRPGLQLLLPAGPAQQADVKGDKKQIRHDPGQGIGEAGGGDVYKRQGMSTSP